MQIELHNINVHTAENPSAFIQETNQIYLNRLSEIADDIALHREKKPIILLSGPSGSGKTTSALMIEKILSEQGIKTHTLSLDNYFSSLTEQEKKLLSLGKLDLESPNRIDSEFLTQQLREIYHCRPIELPIYDFKNSVRMQSGKILHRKAGELVILEGIHSLNPDIINFKDSRTAKIYVSVRTRIMLNGIELHPSKIRLMRRLVRDKLFRKRSFQETLMMFHSVENGENKYIMPYKYRSTYDVDTFMTYEICAYRTILLESLHNMQKNPIIHDVLNFLEHTAPLRPEEITSDSLICEFIGNGQFCY
ncbi:MAG: adenylyl-sulfate kinase [Oscillospiraceae bacterium]|nr:adenylyl-sulfate kinase [Oscillospiraceae bacterium]